MLSEIHISDFTLIKNLTLPFTGKLNVLTGETGAGKSIIIGALNLILGERADLSDIRTGSKNASVEAVFDIGKNEKIKNGLLELGIEPENNLLIIRRTIGQKSGSRNFINDKPVTLKVIKVVGDELVDIHGQHEHQNLLKKEKHIDYLDNFLGLSGKREELRRLFNDYLEKKKILNERKERIEELKEKEELYRFQIKEIEDTQISPGEDKELEKKQYILENAEKLIETIKSSLRTLYENDDSTFAIFNRLKTNIELLCDIDQRLVKGKEAIDNVIFEIEEIAQYFSSYLNKMEFDPEELEMVTKRLDMINGLKMKYGNTIKEINTYRDEKTKEIEELMDVEIRTEQIEKEIDEIREKMVEFSLGLSKERIKRKKELEKRVNKELKELGMGSSKFFCLVEKLKEEDGITFPDGKKYRISRKGIDNVEFQISTNPGEPYMPLKKIVSGGELSRIMLALKSILASLDNVFCMVFDEADAGIGGAIAETVGDKMRRISKERQVITITHLQQIASKGDQHIKVEKVEKNGRAYTYAKVLNKKERVKEIARLISGEKLTKTALEYAKSLLEKEENYNK